MDYHQSIAATCEQTAAALSDILSARGYRLERSFDLRSALHDQNDGLCPYHRASDCHCQYLVLLAYELSVPAPPSVITAHECEAITHLSVEGPPPAPRLMAALEEIRYRLVDAE